MTVLTVERVYKHSALSGVHARFIALGPARTVFLVSLLLSLLALQKGTVNRDGMLYVETARIFMEDGFAAALASFNWPLLPLLMAGITQVTGLHPEISGHVLNTLFMAGTCALLVSCSMRMFPEAGWFVGLVVLALPGLNGYRDELLREYGCWFFVMLSLWLALRWSDRPAWTTALAAQCALAAAALFRPEALALFPALLLWQWFDAPKPERWRRLTMIGSLPVIAFVILMGLLATDQLNAGRIVGDFQRLTLEQFAGKTEALAGILHEYGREQANLILFFGSLAIVPLKFVGKMGIFIVPLVYAFVGRTSWDVLKRNGVFAWAFLAHLLVLCVFVLEMQFLAGRYAAPLLAFAAPLTGQGLWLLTKRFPAWKIPMILAALLLMIGNVVSLAPPKHHFVAAGSWLTRNAADSPRVYVESARAAYYAGWRFSARYSPENRKELIDGLAQGRYDLVVIEVSRKESGIGRWLEDLRLDTVATFTHPNGDAVIIARPGGGHDSASNASAMREKTGSIE